MPSQYIPLAGFLPDADPSQPGILTACNGWLPSPRGMHTAYTAANAAYDALPAACKGLYLSRLTDGSVELYAGTTTRLYKLSDPNWTNVTLGGDSADYSVTSAWRFATLGDITLAVNKENRMQRFTSGDTDFVLVESGAVQAPRASVICTLLGFVMVGAYDQSGYVGDGWHCSALQNYLDWDTTGTGTQCASGRLLDTPGEITALKVLNETAIFFKARSIYRAVYQGLPFVWTFQLLSSDIGAVNHEAVVDLNYALVFMGYDSVWMMAGDGVPQRIDGGIREWLFNDIDRTYIGNVQGLYDRDRGLVYFFYPTRTDGTGALTAWIAWHVESRRWGAGSLSIEWAAPVTTTSNTYDSYFTQFSTWDSIPDTTWASGVLLGSVPYPAVVDTSHKVSYLAGAAGTSTFTTGRIGDENNMITLRRVVPRWSDQPTTATLTNGYTLTAGGTMTSDTARTMDANQRFDMLRPARWHNLALSTTGDAELAGWSVDLVPAGKE